ncbi:Hypothetical protein CINCED_3A007717 [Cinara cedri]|uniref:Uncharacterized protein n=1 Tax=Cinara cedri TaxID=506608 RepID=A0A5E4M847_9HEMI|nr:Hypothetical protein CINCED_3A007717 [Cinara cedri]
MRILHAVTAIEDYGVFRKKIASASAAYTLCSGVAFGYGTVTAAKALFLRPPPVPVTDFNRALLSFAGAAFLAPSLIVPAVMWFETDKLQAYLQEWQRFQVGRPPPE